MGYTQYANRERPAGDRQHADASRRAPSANGNLPILYQNIMLGLPDGIAQDAFLWASDRPDADLMQYGAEAFAREVARLALTMPPLISRSAAIHREQNPSISMSDEAASDLMRFILTRHANLRFGGNFSAPQYTGHLA